MTVRVRFAPSPTGNLHIGTVRAALFNWLFAKSQKGTVILRIEDTDKERSETQYEENINAGIEWLGLTPDEGPKQGGAFGPYRQSERIEQGVYSAVAQQLLDQGRAYYCFLTPEEIEQEKASAIKKGIAYMHSRKSSEMSDFEVKAALASGKPYAIRFKMTEDRVIQFNDLVRGTIDFDCSLLSDFVLMKSDGTPSYNFAVVVDDAAMKISHVVRGEDHISNMPRQIALYEALGYALPQFAHLPMILGPDKSKLSKRHGATAVTEYQRQGFLKSGFLNYLSLLGWSPQSEQELFSLDELITLFGFDRVNKAGAVFDIQKLTWMNGQYIRQLQGQALLDEVYSFIDSGSRAIFDQFTIDKQLMMVEAVRDNLQVLADINRYLEPFLASAEEAKAAILAVEFTESQLSVLQAIFNQLQKGNGFKTKADFATLLSDTCTELSLGKGKVLKPFRLALTGAGSGPDLTEICAFFGKDSIQSRLRYVLD